LRKPKVWIFAGIFVLVVLSFATSYMSASLRRDNAYLKARQGELHSLGREFLEVRKSVDSVESRKSLTRVDGIVQAVDEEFQSLGLSEKVKSVKATAAIEKKYGFEEEADVQVEKVSMNEMTNIFYRLEHAPMAISIKKTTIRTSFEDPTLLNISMTLSFIRPK
jgi:hypothetical protein